MFSLSSRPSQLPQSPTPNPQPPRGFSLLDLLIVLLVLVVILLVAVKQFGTYKQPAQQSAPSAQPALPQ